MEWKWNKLPQSHIVYGLFLLYLIVASFNFPTMRIKVMTAAISIITFFVASKTPILNISMGRVWCYYASLMPIFLTLFAYVSAPIILFRTQ